MGKMKSEEETRKRLDTELEDHTIRFIGDFSTVETAPPPTSRKVTCPKCGHEFEEWEGVIIV